MPLPQKSKQLRLNTMRRLATLFIVLCANIFKFSAQTPLWIYDEQRKAIYPETDYFCGFVIGEQHIGESTEDAMQRLKDMARAEAISSIEIYIEHSVSSNMESRLTQTDGDFSEEVVEQFQNSLKTNVAMQIQGMNTEAWLSLKNSKIYSIAYVSKKELTKKMKKQILVANSQIEYELDNIDNLLEQGQKSKAKINANNALPKFGEIQTMQKTLLAIDSDINDDELQITETNALKRRFLNICTSLEHAISVQIICNTDSSNNVKIKTLGKKIAGQLSTEDYNFVEKDGDETDFRIQLSLEEYQAQTAALGGTTIYTSYVEVYCTITKMITRQVIYMDKISTKGVSTINFCSATDAAYKDVIKIISQKIKTEIAK